MNSSAWDKFRKQQAAEREQLRRLLAGMAPLLARCHQTAPNEIELSALAAMLHSFYTGIENIFKRVVAPPGGAHCYARDRVCLIAARQNLPKIREARNSRSN